MNNRDYIYHESTISICSECLERIPAKFIFRDGQVFLKKKCIVHGEQEELFEENIEYHLSKRDFDKPGTISKIQTATTKGCPFDCGLCPEHDQHSCVGLIEVTKNCDLGCPICYAGSTNGNNNYLSLDKISEMLDFFVDSEGGEAEILQLSGGEPTTHPEIIKIIELARTKNIRYVMLNTNGIKIAEDDEFVKALGQFKGGFEVYLQFDGFTPDVYSYFRGRDLLDLKLKAIENLKKYEIPLTLVTTIEKNINDTEIGKIIEFGLTNDGIRGVNIQPVAYFGRLPQENRNNRITLSGIIKRIEMQLPKLIQPGDIIPLPCNVERVAITYLMNSRSKGFIPITRNIDIKKYLSVIDNTFAFNVDRIIDSKADELFSVDECCNCMSFIKDIKALIPLDFVLKSKEKKMSYIDKQTFRISVTSFVDIYNFDLKSMQKECAHIITTDLRRIPFSAYNMFYRK